MTRRLLAGCQVTVGGGESTGTTAPPVRLAPNDAERRWVTGLAKLGADIEKVVAVEVNLTMVQLRKMRAADRIETPPQRRHRTRGQRPHRPGRGRGRVPCRGGAVVAGLR